MPRAGTRSGSSDETAWAVPPSLRPRLAEKYGPVYAGAEADRRIEQLDRFGACGDRVTERALELGRRPLIGIVDYKTQRNDPIPRDAFRALAAVRVVRVRNPPGLLTGSLRAAVRELVRTGGGCQSTCEFDAEPGTRDENERHRQHPENLFHPPHDENP